MDCPRFFSIRIVATPLYSLGDSSICGRELGTLVASLLVMCLTLTIFNGFLNIMQFYNIHVKIYRRPNQSATVIEK